MRYIACLLAILSLSGCISSVYEVPVVGNVLAGQGDTRAFEQPLPINTQPKRLALGSNFAIGVKEDGTVWSWGSGSKGELGMGKKENREIPQAIPNMTDFVEVAAGSEHVLALRKDGTVWSWGNNEKGALGYKEEGVPWGIPPKIYFDPYQLTPKQLPELKDVVSIAAGSNYSLALDKEGRVWGWGSDINLVINSVKSPLIKTPTIVYENKNIKKMTITAGIRVLLILENGTGLVFGGDIESLDDINEDLHPQKNYQNPYVIPVNNIVDIVDNGVGIMVLRQDGSVWTMGRNINGNLGQCNFKNNVYKGFVQIRPLKKIKQINIQMALDERGYIWAWGESIYIPYTRFLGGSGKRLGYEPCPIKIKKVPDFDFFQPTYHANIYATEDGHFFKITEPKNNFDAQQLPWSWK
ncbi:MAG: hypothetical protein U1E99_09690 [Agitococcus sp.]